MIRDARNSPGALSQRCQLRMAPNRANIKRASSNHKLTHCFEFSSQRQRIGSRRGERRRRPARAGDTRNSRARRRTSRRQATLRRSGTLPRRRAHAPIERRRTDERRLVPPRELPLPARSLRGGVALPLARHGRVSGGGRRDRRDEGLLQFRHRRSNAGPIENGRPIVFEVHGRLRARRR